MLKTFRRMLPIALALTLAVLPGCGSETADNAKDDSASAAPEAERSSVSVIFHNMFGYHEGGKFPVEPRMEQLEGLYFEYMPDVLALQECSFDAGPRAGGIFERMTDGGEYALVEIDEEQIDNPDALNYTPLLYRTDTLKVIDCGYQTYDDVSGDHTKSITWAVFETLGEGNRFAACSTHFFYTGDEKGENARKAEAGQLYARAKGIVRDYDVPVLAGGDLNCTISSEPFKLLTDCGFVDVQPIAAQTEDLNTYHSYPTFDKEKKEYTVFSEPSGDHSRAIDHALLLGDAAIDLYDVITDEAALKSSDHCPILVKLTIG